MNRNVFDGVKTDKLNLAALSNQNENTKKSEPEHFIGISNDLPNKLIRIKAKINSQILDCVLDIGATTSVISSTAANRIKAVQSDKFSSIDLADGSTTKAKSTAALPVIVSDRYYELKFLITPLKLADVLLGLDWFNKNDV